MPPLPEIVAHRGAGRTAVPPSPHHAHRPAAPPENTLPALALGWAQADACEVDVRLTRDRRLVAFHDLSTGRLCERDVEVAGTDLAELSRLDAGHASGAPWSGTRIPTLEEVLDRLPVGRRLWIELKPGPGVVEPLLELHERRPLPAASVTFLSFHLDTLARLKRAQPRFECHLVVRFAAPGADHAAKLRTVDPDDPRGLASRDLWLEESGPDAAARLLDRLVEMALHPRTAGHPPAPPLDGLDVSREHPEGLADAARAAGLAWGAWVVDDAATAVRLAARGAVQLTSDGPADLRHALGAG